MKHIRFWSILASIGFGGWAAPAAADLHTYALTVVNGGVSRSQGTIYLYRMRKPYRVRAGILRTQSLSLSEAADQRPNFPLAVSAGGFTAQSDAVGLITVGGSYLSRLGSARDLPYVICFTPKGARVSRVTAEINDRLTEMAAGCEAVVQTLSPLVADGRRIRTEAKALSWNHIFFGLGGDSDAVVIVQGSLSAAALTEFVAGPEKECSREAGRRTARAVTIEIAADGSARAGCSLRLSTLVTLNLGAGTGATHYVSRLAGDDGSSAPIVLFFDD